MKREKIKRAIRIIEESETFFNSFSFRLFLIFAFAISMAFLEATVVIYLRETFALRRIAAPENVELVLKLPYFALVKNPLVIIPSMQILIIEIFREAATIIMLFTFAFLVGRKWYQKLAVFFLSFGVWDIFYYVFLYLTTGWPQSLTTTDVLFLIPLPWVAPVWLPISISTIFI